MSSWWTGWPVSMPMCDPRASTVLSVLVPTAHLACIAIERGLNCSGLVEDPTISVPRTRSEMTYITRRWPWISAAGPIAGHASNGVDDVHALPRGLQ